MQLRYCEISFFKRGRVFFRLDLTKSSIFSIDNSSNSFLYSNFSSFSVSSQDLSSKTLNFSRDSSRVFKLPSKFKILFFSLSIFSWISSIVSSLYRSPLKFSFSNFSILYLYSLILLSSFL